MIKDELKKLSRENLKKSKQGSLCECYDEAFIKGYELSKKYIAELEATCNKWFEHLKNREEELLNELNNQNTKYNKQIEELEKENAELEKACDETQELLDKQIEATYKLDKENAELKELLEACKQERTEALYRNDQYIKENAELKKQLEMSNKVYNDNCDYSHHIEGQLTKAKEIIKRFSEFVNNGIEYDPELPQEHTDLWNKLCEEAEQFLKENSTYERIQKAKYNYTD